jgi:hypothetical protein
MGRWTAADPIGIADGVNRYAYVRGNPIKLSDPGGTAPPQKEPEEPKLHGVGQVTVQEGETATKAVERGLSEGFVGLEEHQAAQVASQLGMTRKGEGKGGPKAGDVIDIALTDEAIEFIKKEFDGARPRNRSEDRIAPGFIEGRGEEDISPDLAKALEIAAIELKVVELGLAAIGLAALTRAGLSIAGERALIRGAEKGLIAEETKAVSRLANLAGGEAAGAVAGQAAGELAVVEAQAGDSVVTRSAQSLAKTRGEQVVSLGELSAVPAGDRLSLVAHGNRLSLGGLNSSQLSSTINASGVRPSSIELVACQTGCGAFAAEVASSTGAVVRAPLGDVYVLGGVAGVPQVILPGTVGLLPPGQGFRVHLPVLRF